MRIEVDRPSGRGEHPWRAGATYAARTTAVGGAASWWLAAQVARFLSKSESGAPWDRLMDLVAQIDVLHAVVYAALPAAALLVMLPGGRLRFLGRTGRAVAALAMAAVTAGLVFSAPGWSRTMPSRPDFAWACAYLAWNVAGVAWFHGGGGIGRRTRGLLVWLPLAADAAAPMLVWSAYRDSGARMVRWWRPVAAALATAPLLAVWVLAPLPLDTPIRTNPALRLLATGGFHQAIADEQAGRVIAVKTEGNAILSLDGSHPTEAPREVKVPAVRPFISPAWDAASRKMLVMDLDGGRTVRIDADRMQVDRTWPFAGAKIGFPDNCRNRWFAEPQALLLFCHGALFAVCPDGRRVTHRLNFAPGQVVYDRRRKQVLLIEWISQLLFLNPHTLAVEDWINKPYYTERAEIDPETNQYFMTVPMEARVQAVALERPELAASYPTLPAMRVPQLYEKKRWMLLGGFASMLEVRSLPDWRVVDRFVAPSWVRTIDIDHERDVAYLASSVQGVWALDLTRVGTSAIRAWWHRVDPFYHAVRLANAALLRLLKISTAIDRFPPDRQAETIDDRPCEGPAWYEDGAGGGT